MRGVIRPEFIPDIETVLFSCLCEQQKTLITLETILQCSKPYRGAADPIASFMAVYVTNVNTQTPKVSSKYFHQISFLSDCQGYGRRFLSAAKRTS